MEYEEYGYCRISTPKQNIERQERNILKQFPEAHIIIIPICLESYFVQCV